MQDEPAEEMASAGAPRRARPAVAVHAALLLVQLWFATLGVAGKIVLRELPPLGLVTARLLGAAAFLWALRGAQALVTRGDEGQEGNQPLTRRDLWQALVLALLGFAVNQVLFITGLARTTATNAVVLGSTIPVFTFAVAAARGQERPRAARLFGLLLALCGALLLTGLSGLLSPGTLVGNVMLLVNCLSYATYLVLARPFLARFPALRSTSILFLLAALFVLPLGGAALWDGLPRLHLTGALALGYVVVFCTVGTYVLNAYALKRAPASLVATYIYLQPVLGTILAAALLHERPGVETLASGGLILAGLWLVTRG